MRISPRRVRTILATLAISGAGCSSAHMAGTAPTTPPSSAASIPRSEPVAASATPASRPATGPVAVAATELFVFRSSFLPNLHDYLDWVVDEEPETPKCFSSLTGEERDGWQSALTRYRRDVARRDGLRDGGSVALRYRLTELELDKEFTARHRQAVDEIAALLEGAAPAYRRCVWPAQEERNRSWIGEAVPRVRKHERDLREKLSAAFGRAWPRDPIPVDVVHYGTWYGANTVLDPHHIMIGGGVPGNRGPGALEVVFHEASHTLVQPRNGAVARTLAAAGAELGVEVPPNLWHGILFYTAGQAVREALLRDGVEGYAPFHEEVLPRAWPTFLAPLEAHWQTYLDGEIEMDEASRRLLEALAETPEARPE